MREMEIMLSCYCLFVHLNSRQVNHLDLWSTESIQRRGVENLVERLLIIPQDLPDIIVNELVGLH